MSSAFHFSADSQLVGKHFAVLIPPWPGGQERALVLAIHSVSWKLPNLVKPPLTLMDAAPSARQDQLAGTCRRDLSLGRLCGMRTGLGTLPAEPAWLLGHISDLHLDGSASTENRVSTVLNRLADLRRPLDALVITGDISDSASASDYEWLRIRLGQFAAVVCVPGNHDRRPVLRSALLGQEERAGPVNAVHDIGGLTILACDSTVPGQDSGLLSDETLEWLDEALSTGRRPEPAIVAFHHPPVLLHDTYMDAMRQFGAERLAGVVRKHTRVRGILCGHAHQAVRTSFAGIPLVIAPSVAPWSRLPWEKDVTATAPPGFAVHGVTRAGEVTTHFRMIAVDVHDASADESLCVQRDAYSGFGRARPGHRCLRIVGDGQHVAGAFRGACDQCAFLSWLDADRHF